ncbi:DNA cytosine methyltransferase [Clostridium sp. YIM B02551]|uniref:DNA cytosine methyltransferase n=1 Tax=Clostridium sp. YIM B02551 TaxID=2910679 RepID=UPI001EEBFCC6
MKQISVLDEIIVDNFAGGGGASTGIELAIGHSVEIAINHDIDAIAMHKANHPNTEHYCENVWAVDPVKAVRGRKVGLAWFSPDCKHFSKAKGGKPRDKKIRGLAWIVLKWAALVRPRVIMLENVEEFQTWGPLNRRRRPIKSKKGQTYRKWKSQLEALGYDIETRELIAADYGAPTKRKRFFMVARCDGKPIVWPKVTHGDRNSNEVKEGLLKPYVSAAEIIDWDIPCKSIFGRKKPLAENTMKRIAKGIQKFVIDNPEPFIMQIGQTGFTEDRNKSIHEPLTTIVSKQEHCLITPTLIQYHTETTKNGVRGQSIDEPIMTLDSSPRYGLVSAFIIQMNKNMIGTDMNEPVNTIVAGPGHIGEVRAFLIKYYGQGVGQDIKEPLDTIVSKDRFGLVTIYGQDYQIIDIGMRMLEPRELFTAQGFPKNYIISKDYKGKIYPKTKQVARCGNSVPPVFAEVLTGANLPELCEGNGKYREVG